MIPKSKSYCSEYNQYFKLCKYYYNLNSKFCLNWEFGKSPNYYASSKFPDFYTVKLVFEKYLFIYEEVNFLY